MSGATQRIRIVRIDLCDRDARTVVGSVRPSEMYALRDLAGGIRMEINVKTIVPHEKGNSAGTIMFFYTHLNHPVLSISAPHVTVPGQSIELTETPR
jgi:hypothetical protein